MNTKALVNVCVLWRRSEMTLWPNFENETVGCSEATEARIVIDNGAYGKGVI